MTAKFLHDHVKSTWQFSFVCSTIPSSNPFHIVMQNGNIWFLSFLLSFLPFLSSDSTSTAFKSAPNLDLSALILSHYPHYLPFSISFLFCHSMLQKSPWNISKSSQKSLVFLARATMYYLGILGIITTQKVWNSWELLFKMYCFWVVIIPPNQHIASPLAMV